MTEIGKLMKKQRLKLDIKVKDIAKEIGVAESSYREWENGRKIQGEPYLKIAEILQIPVAQLLGTAETQITPILACIDELENHVKNIRKNIMKII